ncbi:MAG: SH3 domain-containing protein [Pseudoxanthomonas sp.]
MVEASGGSVILIGASCARRSARGWRLRAAVLVASFLALTLPAWAGDDQEIRFEVAPGVTAHARLLEDGWIEVGTSRSDQRQRLQASSDEEGHSRLDVDDYNFDGHLDLASSASVGQVNESVVVYLYDARHGQFRELVSPTGPAIQCEGFWSLLPDVASRTLTSSCRSGPMWYSDVYRYQGQQLYLYRSMRMAYLDSERLAPLLTLDLPEESGPLAVWSSFDPAGNAVEHALGDGLDVPEHGVALRGFEATVISTKLSFYSEVGQASTRRYLVKGDRVELLDADVDGNWLQLRYRNASRGPVVGWVKLAEAP